MALFRNFLSDITRLKTLDADYLSHSELAKNVGLLDLVGIGISCSLTFGAFVLVPAACRSVAGPSTAISVLILLVAMTLTGLHFCEISLRFPKACSVYVATYTVFGELFAFLYAWLTICDYTIATAFVAREWSDHARYLFNNSLRAETNGTGYLADSVDVTAILGIAGTTLLFLCSMKVIGIISLILGVISALIVSSSILVGFFYSNSKNWIDYGFFAFGGKGVFSAAGVIAYAFINFDVFSCITEETTTAGRAFPVLIPLSVIVSFVYFFLLSIVDTLTVPYVTISEHVALPVLYGSISVPASRYVLSVGSVCGLTGTLLAMQIPASRVLYSLADDGLVFGMFRRTIKRSGMPLIGAAVVNVVACSVAAMPTSWYRGILTVTFPFRCLICILSCVMMRYADYTGTAGQMTQNTVYYSNMNKRRDKIYTYTYVNSNGSIVSAAAPVPTDSNFSLADSVSSDFITSNIAAIRIRSSSFDDDTIDSQTIANSTGLVRESSSLLINKHVKEKHRLPSSTSKHSNFDDSMIEARSAQCKAHGGAPLATDGVGSTLAVNGGHDCALSPCSPYSDDFRAHSYHREIPDVPFYHAFDGQNPAPTSQSYTSLPGSTLRSVHLWIGLYVVFSAILVAICVFASDYIAEGEWWAVCSLTTALLATCGSGVYVCRFPKVRSTCHKKAPGVPALSMVAILILLAMILSADVMAIAAAAGLLLPGSIVYLAYGRTHSLERATHRSGVQMPMQFNADDQECVMPNPSVT